MADIFGLISGIANAFGAILRLWHRDHNRSEAKPIIELFARSCTHRFVKEEGRSILKVHADVALKHISGDRSRVVAVYWNNQRGRAIDEDCRSDCEIPPGKISFFHFYFDVPVSTVVEPHPTELTGRIRVECSGGCTILFECTSKLHGR